MSVESVTAVFPVPVPLNPRVDFPQLRAELARKRVSIKRFAEQAGISPVYMSYYLNERRVPSQMSRIKIATAANYFALPNVYDNADLPPRTELSPVVELLLISH